MQELCQSLGRVLVGNDQQGERCVVCLGLAGCFLHDVDHFHGCRDLAIDDQHHSLLKYRAVAVCVIHKARMDESCRNAHAFLKLDSMLLREAVGDRHIPVHAHLQHNLGDGLRNRIISVRADSGRLESQLRCAGDGQRLEKPTGELLCRRILLAYDDLHGALDAPRELYGLGAGLDGLASCFIDGVA